MSRKQFSYRGYTADQLQKLPMDEFIRLLPSRQRRSLMRGLPPRHIRLLEKIRKIKAQNIQTEHWGTAAIPKRFILEVIRRLKTELKPEEFLNPDFALHLILDELEDEFLISPENQKKVEQYYTEERTEIATNFAAFQRAEILWNNTKFESQRDIALATQTEDQLVRFYLFQFWKETQN